MSNIPVNQWLIFHVRGIGVRLYLGAPRVNCDLDITSLRDGLTAINAFIIFEPRSSIEEEALVCWLLLDVSLCITIHSIWVQDKTSLSDDWVIHSFWVLYMPPYRMIGLTFLPPVVIAVVLENLARIVATFGGTWRLQHFPRIIIKKTKILKTRRNVIHDQYFSHKFVLKLSVTKSILSISGLVDGGLLVKVVMLARTR